ncbi:unnamed protein product [Lathyrus oleraceus]
MAATKVPAFTVIFLLAFFILTSDMCIKLEGRRVDGTQPCKYDADCQPGCPSGQKGCCIRGRCWCYSPPVSANNIPGGTSQDAICFAN